MTTQSIALRPATRDLPGLLGLIFILAAFAVFGFFSVQRVFASGAASTETKALIYGATFIFEWILAAYAAWRLRPLGLSVKDLVDLPSTAKGWLIDVGVTVGFFLVWAAVGQGLTFLLKPGTPKHLVLLPSNSVEYGLWIVLSLTAGFCEELVFRGYLQKALEFSTNAGIAIVTQGVIFGLAHAYQGIKLATLIIVLGTMLGWLAHWRRKLWPGMMFHAVIDIVGAVFR
jgi:uncharacterized protein